MALKEWLHNRRKTKIQEGIRPCLQITVMPAEVCEQDGLTGKIQVLRSMGHLYHEKEIQPVQQAAEDIKRLISGL